LHVPSTRRRSRSLRCPRMATNDSCGMTGSIAVGGAGWWTWAAS
jgi:hypothetical protein